MEQSVAAALVVVGDTPQQMSDGAAPLRAIPHREG